jgi:hypothetical protein
MGSHTGHLFAAFGAFAANRHTFIHIPDAGAVLGTSFADFGAHFAGTGMERRIAQHKVGRQLTHFRAADHQAKVFRLNVPPAHFQTLVHRRLQAGLGATVADVYTRLNGSESCSRGFLGFSLRRIHDGILLKYRNNKY